MNFKLQLIILLSLFATNGFGKNNSDSTLTLFPENIITLTFNNNNQIKAAYYELEAAKYNFKLFESEYTQFNPLIVAPGVKKDFDNKYESDIALGMKKEFFNGAYVSSSLGNSNEWGNSDERGYKNYIETDIGFPLFSSSKALERIIKRTFEENELYTKNLDYVDAVRENIKLALEQYFDLVPRIKSYEALKEYRNELKKILLNNSSRISEADKQQIEGEITNLNSDITGWEIELYSLQLKMQLYTNIGAIKLNQLMKIDVDFNKPDYFGEYYLKAHTDTIFAKALENDTQFQVLGIIKKNAEEKKRLAEKGGIDIYATTGGRYNYNGIIEGEYQKNSLEASAGIKIKVNDRKVLENTIAKAQADINAIEYTIIDRRKLIQSDILQLKDALTKKKEQLISSRESLVSWEKIYNSKKQMYLSGQESIDNLIQAFRSLVETKENFLDLENDYLDRIRDLDYVCGEYFTIININN